MFKYLETLDIKTREPFSVLFPIDPLVRTAIKESMEDRGFDESKPIDVWAQKGVLIDGHTRYSVARELGMGEVPVYLHDFTDEDAALEYAVKNQRNRRNLTDADILRCVEVLDKRKSEGRPAKSSSTELVSGSTRDATAEIVGTSPVKVQKARTVLDHADEETRESVLSGKMTINKAYNETQERRRFEDDVMSEFLAPADDLEMKTPAAVVKPASRATFNRVNENIDWAKWSWNPVTGCKHDCIYCYARDIANRFYPQKFEPTFLPDRLSAPHNTKVPAAAKDNIGEKNCFVCSMADLFGKWVPQEWIDAVLTEVRNAPQWNFLFLSKFPQRYPEIDWPDNAWVGTTVDRQYRVKIAEKAFREVKAPVKWLSVEPMLERLKFESLEMFDWVVIGGQSKSTQAGEFQPEWEWVEELVFQAREAGCKVYFKPNLKVRPVEYPGMKKG